MQDRGRLEPLPLNDEEREFEQMVTRLAPPAPGFNAGEIWMNALARRQRRQLGFWRIAAGGLAACLVAALWLGPAQPTFVPVRVVRSLTVAAHVNDDLTVKDFAVPLRPLGGRGAGDDDDSYMNLRQRVMLRGLSALNVSPQRIGVAASVSTQEPRIEPLPRVEPVVTPAAAGPIDRFFNLLQKGPAL